MPPIHHIVFGSVNLCTYRMRLQNYIAPINIALDSKVHGTNMEPIWGRQDPGGISEILYYSRYGSYRKDMKTDFLALPYHSRGLCLYR